MEIENEAKKKQDKQDEEEAKKKKRKEEEEFEREKLAKELPEVKIYTRLLLTGFLIDLKMNQEACDCVTSLLQYMQPFNRRSMDHLSAYAFYFYSLTHELISTFGTIRNELLAMHRTACLQRNEPGQAALIVSILRNYLKCKMFDQADKFRLNTSFPEHCSHSYYARYLFYTGQINALQLHYSDAYENLTQALRKAPQIGALGFRQRTNKLLIIVQLLMGDIPERSVFTPADLKESLEPYFDLTQAVRVGDISAFGQVVLKYKETWEMDGVASLLVRLRSNVIKTGLRNINISYSRISISDVCGKLNFTSEEDAEMVVAKAIHDGVIDAILDRKSKFLYSSSSDDTYSTHEPQAAFHKRIMFSMDIHNDAVKSMRFPAEKKAAIDAVPLGEEEIDIDDLEDDSD